MKYLFAFAFFASGLMGCESGDAGAGWPGSELLCSAEVTDREGALLRRTTYTYDENGNMLTQQMEIERPTAFMFLNAHNYLYTYAYDANGKLLIEERTYGGQAAAADLTQSYLEYERITYSYDTHCEGPVEEEEEEEENQGSEREPENTIFDTDGGM